MTATFGSKTPGNHLGLGAWTWPRGCPSMSGGFTPLREDRGSREAGLPRRVALLSPWAQAAAGGGAGSAVYAGLPTARQARLALWLHPPGQPSSDLQTSPRESPERSSKPRALLLTFKLTLNFSINVVNSCKGIISGML